MHRKYLWEKWGKKTKRKKGKVSLVLKIKTSVPNSHFLSAKPFFLDLLPKDVFLM